MRKNIFLNDEAAEEKPPELTAVNLVPAPRKLTAVNSPSPAPQRPRPLGGVVGAMRDTLGQMATGPVGDAVVEIDTALIDDSFVPDRMESAKLHHDALVQAIREQGQLVPVLLRPRPDLQRYEIAYGHRRVRAARELGRPIKAVVRSLSDDELVVAQGQENNARRDLSFIEKATFAMTLEDRGFHREKTIVPALSVDKTELSRLIAIARAVPPSITAAIGPAPKAGRGRWADLAARLEVPKAVEKAQRLIAGEFAQVQDSDERFARLFAEVAVSAPGRALKARVWTDPRGRKLARIERGQGRFVLSIDEKLEPAFGEYLESRLSEIFQAFAAGRDASTAFPNTKEEG